MDQPVVRAYFDLWVEVLREGVDTARFAATRHVAVVHAGVANQLLEEVGHCRGGIFTCGSRHRERKVSPMTKQKAG